MANLVQIQRFFVRVLEQQVFAFGLFHAVIDDLSEHSPNVPRVQINLLRELVGLVELCA